MVANRRTSARALGGRVQASVCGCVTRGRVISGVPPPTGWLAGLHRFVTGFVVESTRGRGIFVCAGFKAHIQRASDRQKDAVRARTAQINGQTYVDFVDEAHIGGVERTCFERRGGSGCQCACRRQCRCGCGGGCQSRRVGGSRGRCEGRRECWREGRREGGGRLKGREGRKQHANPRDGKAHDEERTQDRDDETGDILPKFVEVGARGSCDGTSVPRGLPQAAQNFALGRLIAPQYAQRDGWADMDPPDNLFWWNLQRLSGFDQIRIRDVVRFDERSHGDAELLCDFR